MLVYKSPEGEYPLYYGDVQGRNPGWNPGMSLPDGWVQVEDTQVPEYAENQTVEELEPRQEGNKYFRNWLVRDLTEEELAWQNAPVTALEKIQTLELTDAEKFAINRGTVFIP